MESIKDQLRALDIPYPQKQLLEKEVLQDLEHFPQSEEVLFSVDDIQKLQELHTTQVSKWLSSFSLEARRYIETSFAFLPLILAFTFIIKEEKMMNFIKEGGAGMYLILLIGFFLLSQEALKVFRLLVVKKHSQQNLMLDTTSVLLGCLALMFIGIGWSFLGFYFSATYVTQQNMSGELLLIGAKESMTPLILSSLFCTLIVLAHYATRKTLLVWRAPVT